MGADWLRAAHRWILRKQASPRSDPENVIIIKLDTNP